MIYQAELISRVQGHNGACGSIPGIETNVALINRTYSFSIYALTGVSGYRSWSTVCDRSPGEFYRFVEILEKCLEKFTCFKHVLLLEYV